KGDWGGGGGGGYGGECGTGNDTIHNYEASGALSRFTPTICCVFLYCNLDSNFVFSVGLNAQLRFILSFFTHLCTHVYRHFKYFLVFALTNIDGVCANNCL
ncbi:hypothetical protein ACJX0J_032402, partial [Zea mays]